MVAERELVRDRLDRIRYYVADLRVWAGDSRDVFMASRERQYAVLHALQLAIEACIEVGTHICAADALGTPASYAETFDRLEQAGVLDEALAGDMRAMACFRNRIVHLYWDVDMAEVHAILTGRLQDFDRYLAAIERYLGPDDGRLSVG